MSERIDHAAQSEGIVECAVSRFGEKMITESNLVAKMAVAQVHATLALAEQQRIANLIALINTDQGGCLGTSAYGALVVMSSDRHRTFIDPDIAAALGIRDDDE